MFLSPLDSAIEGAKYLFPHFVVDWRIYCYKKDETSLQKFIEN